MAAQWNLIYITLNFGTLTSNMKWINTLYWYNINTLREESLVELEFSILFCIHYKLFNMLSI